MPLQASPIFAASISKTSSLQSTFVTNYQGANQTGRVSLITNRRGLQPLYYGTHQLVYLAVLINTCFHSLPLTQNHLL